MAAHLVVLLVAALFVALGLWQLSRLEERQLANTVGESRFTSEPVETSVLLGSAAGDTTSLTYRRAISTGVFDPINEVLIRSQIHLGIAGFHVITPLVGESGEAVLVNRGWVPLVLDEVPVEDALPPDVPVTVEGWVNSTQERRGFGPTDPEDGRLVTMARVDIERIQQQVPYPLAPVYLVAIGERANELPVPTDLPSFDDEGPHLAYSIQWFAFAIIGLVGYVFLTRRQLRQSA